MIHREDGGAILDDAFAMDDAKIEERSREKTFERW
jgi:hypothetical protein